MIHPINAASGRGLQWKGMIEHLHPGASAERARVALFDFDGTLSP
jgi:hypothetical protein